MVSMSDMWTQGSPGLVQVSCEAGVASPLPPHGLGPSLHKVSPPGSWLQGAPVPPPPQWPKPGNLRGGTSNWEPPWSQGPQGQPCLWGRSAACWWGWHRSCTPSSRARGLGQSLATLSH